MRVFVNVRGRLREPHRRLPSVGINSTALIGDY